MSSKKVKSLNQVILSLIGQRLVVFWILAFFIIFTSLAVFLLAQEKSKYDLLTEQIISQIKPLLQVGDEISTKSELDRIIRRGNYNGISLTNNDDIDIRVSNLEKGRNETLAVGNPNIFKLATEDVLYFKRSFSIFKGQDKNFLILVSYQNINRDMVFKNSIFTSVFLLAILTLVLLTILTGIKNKIVSPFLELKTYIKNFSEESEPNEENRKKAQNLKESFEVLEEFENLQSVLSEKNIALIQKSIEEKRGEFASNTIHDLKSYISIIQSIINTEGKNLSEDNHEALKKTVSSVHLMTQKILNFDQTGEVTTSAFLLDSLVQEVVDLKNIEYSGRNLEVLSLNSYNEGIFVKANQAELKNILSNIMNNSVEALIDKTKGIIKIKIEKTNGFAKVEIRDNGAGISSEIIKNIFNQDFSTKTSTENVKRGKGLYSAKERLDLIGGEIEVSSIVGEGTKLVLFIPLSGNRDWFPKKINISGIESLVLVDDDLVALNRLERFAKDQELLKSLNITKLSSLTSLRKLIKENKVNFKKTLFFIDNDFSGQQETGYDFICNFKINESCALITNRFEDDNFIKKCEKNGLKVIPKNIAEGILISKTDEAGLFPSENYDFIVIDDDDLTRTMYSKLFEMSKLKVCIYEDVEPFYKASKGFSLKTPIIIDSKLENGVKGEIEALKIKGELGFSNIYLATNYPKSKFEDLKGIKEILSKEKLLSSPDAFRDIIRSLV